MTRAAVAGDAPVGIDLVADRAEGGQGNLSLAGTKYLLIAFGNRTCGATLWTGSVSGIAFCLPPPFVHQGRGGR